jgi:hypothetical protein
MKPFDEGFVTFEKAEGDNRALLLRKPTVFLSKGGYAIFNNGATRLLMGVNDEFPALRLGYNPHTNILAMKPEREHIGYPETVRISKGGGYRRAGIITFKNLAGLFNMEFTGRRYPVVLDRKTGVAEVNLNKPIKAEQKLAPRVRKPKKVAESV